MTQSTGATTTGKDELNFSLTSCDSKHLAMLIVVSAEETAPYFARTLTTASQVTPQEVLPNIKLELCVLYLDLMDRDVFAERGEEARNIFADSLLAALSGLVKEKTGLAPTQFADFCNERQIEYSSYARVVAEPYTSPAGTLLWEFGKRLGLRYQGYNYVALQLFTYAAMQQYLTLLDALKQERKFRG